MVFCSCRPFYRCMGHIIGNLAVAIAKSADVVRAGKTVMDVNDEAGEEGQMKGPPTNNLACAATAAFGLQK